MTTIAATLPIALVNSDLDDDRTSTNLAINAKHARRHYERTIHEFPRLYSQAVVHFTEHAMPPRAVTVPRGVCRS